MITTLTPDLEFPTLDKLLARYEQPRRRQRIRPVYEAMLAEATEFARPQALYGEFALAETTPFSAWLSSETAALVLAVCTLGADLDRRVERLGQSDLAMAVVLEEIALALLVNLTQGLHRQLRRQYHQAGFKAGPAYRPGVGRWPIELQRALFDLLPAAQIQVSLTEELYMLPLQSTSLIIPILQKAGRRDRKR